MFFSDWASSGDGWVVSAAVRAFLTLGFAVGVSMALLCTDGTGLLCFVALVGTVVVLITLEALSDLLWFFNVGVVVRDNLREDFNSSLCNEVGLLSGHEAYLDHVDFRNNSDVFDLHAILLLDFLLQFLGGFV